jgi:hypothetical protein
MKKLALLALTTLITLSAALPSQAKNNPYYPQDLSWDYVDQGANGGGAGGAGGGN